MKAITGLTAAAALCLTIGSAGPGFAAGHGGGGVGGGARGGGFGGVHGGFRGGLRGGRVGRSGWSHVGRLGWDGRGPSRGHRPGRGWGYRWGYGGWGYGGLGYFDGYPGYGGYASGDGAVTDRPPPSAVPVALGIREPAVQPPAIYVIGSSRRSGRTPSSR